MEIKGISTVIASVLMLMIVIALAGTAYLYISGTFTSKTATTFEIIESVNDTVTIRNSGTESITNIKATLDGGDVNIAVVPNIQGLVGYWSFNEGSGSTTADNSGNGNVGTLFNNPTWVDGKFGKALWFDGVDDYVLTGSTGLNNQEITINVWIKPDTSNNPIYSGQNRIASVLANGGFYLYNDIGDGKSAAHIVHYWGRWSYTSTPDNIIENGKWYPIAFVISTVNGGTQRIYVNGELRGENTNIGFSSINLLEPNIGRASWGGTTHYFHGLIDEVAIYNRALSESEIKQLHSGLVSPGQTATIKPLISLSKGTHTLRLCTSSMCSTAILTII
ncbi:MAG: hypothetical protein KQA38_02280 [Candidatus Aenigmarchaeota archaeon]|nr:hypothetical protein [Candidatus Aenigmarchaeota archaeon]